jgi:hypothetical protein
LTNAVKFDENPVCGAVDDDEQIAPCGLVGHLGQILDIDVNEARLVVPAA